ncbi:hypothetical protein LY78DRAFT_576854 [Colletotrichum sublineola]|nr:hypothetical protein LY78DRAFT_576854 [Colletotrichum sublineola]
MNDHGRKLSWTAQLSPYLRSLKMKKNIMPSPKPKSPKSPKSPKNSREEDSDFQIIHTPDRPERPISRTAIPTDEQCMEFLMSLQRQEENRRGGVKSGLKMWPYSQEDEPEDRRYLRSVRVESVQFEEARLARTNSSGPARMVEVGRSSTKSTLATPRVSDAEEEEEEEDDDDDADNESIVEPKRCLHAALSPPPTLHLSQTYLDIHTPRANTSRWSDDSIESRLSSREHDSPCVQRCQRATLRSSAEALSSPTVFGDDSMEPSTPPLLTPVKVRPATPFTDPHLGAVTDPTTPPPSDQVAHLMHVSPAPVPRKYSWRSSRDTILNAEAPVSKLPSWLPEPRLREEDKKQQQGGEPEVYGDWADYYFEDGNFWDDYSDGGSEEDETRVETEIDADEQDEAGTEKEDQEEEKKEDQKDRRQADEGVYPRYESFIEDYKKNVMSVTIKEV